MQRPLKLDDAGAVADLMIAQEFHDAGEASVSEADILGDWQHPAFPLAGSTIGVFDGERLVAYGEITSTQHGEAAVHPDYRRRGLGTQLAHWMQATATGFGLLRTGGQVPAGSDGDRLLESLGYAALWTAWGLILPEGATIPAAPLPTGFTVRGAGPADLSACWSVTEDAFLEWSKREREPEQHWIARVTGRPGFDLWNLRVVEGPGDDIVGVAIVYLDDDTGYIARLATRADHRGRGFGLALMADAFGVAASHGATTSRLATDSRSGALSLYEKAGMVVTSTWIQRAIDLGPAAD